MSILIFGSHNTSMQCLTKNKKKNVLFCVLNSWIFGIILKQAQTKNYIKIFLIYEFGFIYFAQYEKIRNVYDNKENCLIISCHEANWPFNPKVWIWKYPQLLLHVGNERSQVKSLFCVVLLYSMILGTGQSYILLSSYKCTWLVFPSFSTYF